MGRKKVEVRRCPWCGVKLDVKKPACPRGSQCERDESNHHSLMDRIKAGK